MTRVLLLADDESVAKVATERLATETSCEADSASSVPEAFEKLAARHFDFVVIDRVEDGFVAARKIEARLAREPFPATIVVSIPAAFHFEEYLTSVARHCRYLVEVVANAMEWQWAASAPSFT